MGQNGDLIVEFNRKRPVCPRDRSQFVPGRGPVCPRDGSLRLLNALNSEDRGLKVRFSLATIAFDRESAQMSQILSSQGKNAPSNPYPHYLVRLAASRFLFVLDPVPPKIFMFIGFLFLARSKRRALT